MRQVLIAILLTLTAATAGWAQPTTQPGPGPFGGRRGGQLMSPEMQDWGEKYMPNLTKIAALSGRGRGPRRQRSMNMINARMHDLEQITDPAIRQRVVENIATEDKIAGYVLELDSATARDAREAIQGKIRSTMRELVKGLLADREERLKRLQARLADEQKQLERDRNEVELLVQRRINPFMMLIPATNPSGESPAVPANAMDIPAPQPK